MVAILLSWLIMGFVFLSMGDLMLLLYNRLTKRAESYGFVDLLLFGLSFVTIVISIASLWMPVNHYLLAAFMFASIIYWAVNAERLKAYRHKLHNRFNMPKGLPVVFLAFTILAVLIVLLWQFPVFDSMYYHLQNIRWNEEYSVVPGLGNLENRYAFNSSYMLLSGMFSLRFLFGEGIFALQSFFLMAILMWIMLEIYRSGFDIRRIALLAIYWAFIYVFHATFTTTSTDALPNLISFYLIARLLIHPHDVKRHYLFVVLIPVLLITFKISIVPLTVISLYALFQLVRQKDFRTLIVLLVACLLVVAPWLVRNVIISGYLVFPMYEIDLFSFDWEMPAWVAVDERKFIHDCAQDMWNAIKGLFKGGVINIISGVMTLYGVFVIAAPFSVAYGYFRKKMDATIWLIYIALFLVTIIWYFQGPDPRFIAGVLTATVFLNVYILLPDKKIESSTVQKAIMGGFVVVSLIWGAWRAMGFIDKHNLAEERPNVRSKWSVLLKPYPQQERLKAIDIAVDDYEPYQLSDSITIYISKSRVEYGGRMVTHDMLPSTVDPRDERYKYQPIETIEARGNSLQDGFRPKTLERPVIK